MGDIQTSMLQKEWEEAAPESDLGKFETFEEFKKSDMFTVTVRFYLKHISNMKTSILAYFK